MNRQRNRRQRDGHKSNAGSPATPQQAAGTVPTAEQVVPGAAVFIVLEEDQPSGRETPGTVQHVLTRGNHPRGIKVRLHGGMVGRVQRMGGGAGGASAAGPERAGVTAGGARPVWTDVRLGGLSRRAPSEDLGRLHARLWRRHPHRRPRDWGPPGNHHLPRLRRFPRRLGCRHASR